MYHSDISITKLNYGIHDKLLYDNYRGLPKSFNNSTSTLLEESIICQDGRTARNSSLRRKKSRLKKKHLVRRIVL